MLDVDQRLAVEANAAAFASLVADAEVRARNGRDEAAAVRAQVAAWFAWVNHTGWFASARLEEVLRQLAERVPTHPEPSLGLQARSATVHVVTQLYQTGGSTQGLMRWTEQSDDRDHIICVTGQGALPLPTKVRERLDSRVRLVRLDRGRGGLRARASRLRALAAEADLVVLHTHSHDVVPMLAFGARSDPAPPIALFDHADHAFWLGVSVADRVVSMRRSGSRLAVTRRGVELSRTVTLPRPLCLPTRVRARADARDEFAVKPDQVLLATAADESKYRSAHGASFIDVFEPIVMRHPQSVLLAAGPSPEEAEWSGVAHRTGGRMRAVGPLDDASTLQQAADIYVDSYPFASLTSLLEAGAYGTPLVTFRGHPPGCEVLGSDTEGVDEAIVGPRSARDLESALSELLCDPLRRLEIGRRTATAVLDVHERKSWKLGVEALYVTGGRLADLPHPGEPTYSDGPLDQLVCEVMSASRFSDGRDGAIAAHLALLPPAERAAEWFALRRRGYDARPRSLVSARTLASLARAAHALGIR